VIVSNFQLGQVKIWIIL